ncbi:bifunctional protein RIB2 [Staphylotrichum tortipilum]|uniref:Bifunctional protein RIB2 n=1 Tax=Staphylotrichum tortipilum TaxID=2831512 RepID=A0AAN6MN54_9PEZI|nr:bifunctional protein RIB2 [Staphylotrichum longicolle]
MAAYPTIIKGDHKGYMKCALEEARRSTPSPSKFCVGAVLVDADDNKILSTGYSKELQPESPDDPGSTHAEHCCFIKIAQRHGVQASEIAPFLPPNTRLSASRTCVDRILDLDTGIKTVYVGIREPDTFIQRNEGIRRLEDAGVKVVLMDEDPGLRALILEATFAGHDKRD